MRLKTRCSIESRLPRLALITGASSGLGRALCHLLAQKGIRLIVTGRNPDKLEGEIIHVADLAKPRHELIKLIRKHVPDLVINNAGFGLYGNALSHTTKEQMDILEVNANAVLEISLEAAKAMIQAKIDGTIVNISSAAAFFPYPTLAVYAASKAFVGSFSEAFDMELEAHGIRILCSYPGPIATEFAARASKHKVEHGSSSAMSPEKAAEYVWKQIEFGKREYIFDWRTRWSVYLARLFPKCAVKRVLRLLIAKRHASRDI